MKTFLECVPCLVRQTYEAVSSATDDESLRESILREALQDLSDMRMDQSPPHMATAIHRKIRERTGISDPYREIKSRSNQSALGLFQGMKGMVQSSGKPLPERNRPTPDQPISKGETVMRIAIPIAAGKLAMHFGHCESFALLDVDPKAKKIEKRQDVTPPAHAPGVLPKWLAEQKATMIIAGGMGSRAQSLFAENGIEVMVGAPSDTPEKIAMAYLEGTLTTSGNICDH